MSLAQGALAHLETWGTQVRQQHAAMTRPCPALGHTGGSSVPRPHGVLRTEGPQSAPALMSSPGTSHSSVARGCRPGLLRFKGPGVGREQVPGERPALTPLPATIPSSDSAPSTILRVTRTGGRGSLGAVTAGPGGWGASGAGGGHEDCGAGRAGSCVLLQTPVTCPCWPCGAWATLKRGRLAPLLGHGSPGTRAPQVGPCFVRRGTPSPGTCRIWGTASRSHSHFTICDQGAPPHPCGLPSQGDP